MSPTWRAMSISLYAEAQGGLTGAIRWSPPRLVSTRWSASLPISPWARRAQLDLSAFSYYIARDYNKGDPERASGSCRIPPGQQGCALRLLPDRF